eukprot:9847982-Lingulodinium_polyedra.AAC.1
MHPRGHLTVARCETSPGRACNWQGVATSLRADRPYSALQRALAPLATVPGQTLWPSPSSVALACEAMGSHW